MLCCRIHKGEPAFRVDSIDPLSQAIGNRPGELELAPQLLLSLLGVLAAVGLILLLRRTRLVVYHTDHKG